MDCFISNVGKHYLRLGILGLMLDSIQLFLLLLSNQQQSQAVQLPYRYYLQNVISGTEKIALILTAAICRVFPTEKKLFLHVNFSS